MSTKNVGTKVVAKTEKAKSTSTANVGRASGKVVKKLTPAAQNAVNAVKPIKPSKVKSVKAIVKKDDKAKIVSKAAVRTNTSVSTQKLVSQDSDATLAKVIEVTAESTISFEDALQKAVSRTHKSLRNVRSVWVKSQSVDVVNGKITTYHIDAKVVFILD
jgi:flavin-binding protein dodecin